VPPRTRQGTLGCAAVFRCAPTCSEPRPAVARLAEARCSSAGSITLASLSPLQDLCHSIATRSHELGVSNVRASAILVRDVRNPAKSRTTTLPQGERSFRSVRTTPLRVNLGGILRWDPLRINLGGILPGGIRPERNGRGSRPGCPESHNPVQGIPGEPQVIRAARLRARPGRQAGPPPCETPREGILEGRISDSSVRSRDATG
jgi:hypothetical protein